MNEIWHIQNDGKRYRGVNKLCENCNNIFTDRINGSKKFCSLKCSGEKSRNRVEVTCAYCGGKKYISQSKTKNSKSGLYFCDKDCKCKAQRIGGIEEIMPDHYGSSTTRSITKRFRDSIDNLICVGCGEDRRYLICVHHIDGDHTNNLEENLEILCGNCHIIRHLKLVDGEWIYNTSSLTPREIIPQFSLN